MLEEHHLLIILTPEAIQGFTIISQTLFTVPSHWAIWGTTQPWCVQYEHRRASVSDKGVRREWEFAPEVSSTYDNSLKTIKNTSEALRDCWPLVWSFFMTHELQKKRRLVPLTDVTECEFWIHLTGLGHSIWPSKAACMRTMVCASYKACQPLMYVEPPPSLGGVSNAEETRQYSQDDRSQKRPPVLDACS